MRSPLVEGSKLRIAVYMEELMEQSQETVVLGLRNENKIIIIENIDAKKDFKITSSIGTAMPLLAGFQQEKSFCPDEP